MGEEHISPLCSEVIDSITDANSGCLDVVCVFFGLTWQVNVIKMLLNFFFNY